MGEENGGFELISIISLTSTASIESCRRANFPRGSSLDVVVSRCPVEFDDYISKSMA